MSSKKLGNLSSNDEEIIKKSKRFSLSKQNIT